MARTNTKIPIIESATQELSPAEVYKTLSQWDEGRTSLDTMRGRVRRHIAHKKDRGDSEKLYPCDLIEIAERFKTPTPSDIPHSVTIRPEGMSAKTLLESPDTFGDRQTLIDDLKRCKTRCKDLEKENEKLKDNIEHRIKSGRRGIY